MPVIDFFLNDISPITKNLRFDVGATLPVLRVRVMDGNDPVDLAGGTATFTMKDKDGGIKVFGAPAIIEGDGSSGIVRYEWIAADTDVARIYFGQFTISLAGDTLIVPNDADQVLRIVLGKSDFQRETVIEQQVAQGIQVVALGGTPTLDAVGRWFKVVLSALDFTAAASSQSLTLFQLPAGGVIEMIKAKHSEAFAGGAISAYTIELGITGTPKKYMSPFDVFSAPAATNHRVSTSGDEESHDELTDILVTGEATGGNVDDAMAGTVEIWVKGSTVLASGGIFASDGLAVQKDGVTVAGGPFRIVDFEGFTDVTKTGEGTAKVEAPADSIILLGATSLAIHSDNLVAPSTEASLGSKAIDIQSDRTLATQIVSGAESIGIGARATIAGANAIGIGRDISIGATHARSVAIGDAAATTAADQIMLGTSMQTVVTPGLLQIADGALATPSLNFASEQTTGMFLAASGAQPRIGFGVNGGLLFSADTSIFDMTNISTLRILTLQGVNGNTAIDLGTTGSALRSFRDTSGTEVADLDSLVLRDGGSVDALDWLNRLLIDGNGTTILDWSASDSAFHVQNNPIALDDTGDPGSVPVGAAIIFVDSGSLKARTSSGVTTLAV